MAPAKKKTGGKVVKKKTTQPNPLFQPDAKNLRVGGAVRPKGRDLSRFVKWPRYIRIQRQRKILYQRLKVPPSINQFSKTADKNLATELFKLLVKYQPESKQAKKDRLKAAAAAKASGKDAPAGEKKLVLKYGLKHVTQLVEDKKVKLVVIAHDVNPIELVVWLPQLCRKEGIPFVIVKGKARLGALVHKKTAAVVAVEDVSKGDKDLLEQISSAAKSQFNDKRDRNWGGGIMGLKTQKRLEAREKAIQAELAKKAQY